MVSAFFVHWFGRTAGITPIDRNACPDRYSRLTHQVNNPAAGNGVCVPWRHSPNKRACACVWLIARGNQIYGMEVVKMSRIMESALELIG